MPKAVHGLTTSCAPETTRRHLLSKIPAIAAGAALVGSVPTGVLAAGPRSWSPEFLDVLRTWAAYEAICEGCGDYPDTLEAGELANKTADALMEREVTCWQDVVEIAKTILIHLAEVDDNGDLIDFHSDHEPYWEALFHGIRTMAEKDGLNV